MVDFSDYARFEPSHRAAPQGTRLGAVNPAEPVHISLYLKPIDTGEQPASREAMAEQRARHHQDGIRLVEEFARAHGLTVEGVEPARRLVRLSGTAEAVQAAFRTTLSRYERDGRAFRGREGTLELPQALHGVVEAVLGIDTREQAQPRLVRAAAAATSAGYLPNAVAQLYNFPTSVTGAGQCIALIELGGGYLDSDTAASFTAMGLSPPAVSAISVDGAANAPTPDSGANAEVALDIQVAGGAAPGASIAVYFAPNTSAGFADAISQAVHDTTTKPSVISISWGSAEPNWTQQTAAAMNSAMQDAGTLGVSVFVAAGDNLATDGVTDGNVHVDFPAASPYAIGCGGTRLDASGGTVSDEVVWNDGTAGTGGGVSALFPVPAFQSNVTLPTDASTGATGRGVPDVAGNAAPGTGYQIVVNGQNAVVGGTSAVAPLWAGLAALINQAAQAPIGFILPTLYGQTGTLREITDGNNIPSGGTLGYTAGPGWNACTGLGVPNGQALFNALTGAPATN